MADKASLTLALDAMGGDGGAEAVLDGADRVRHSHPSIHFLLFGDESQLAPLLEARPGLQACASLRHADEVVRNDDKPAVALKAKKRSSMRLAINAVRDGEADACVSSGNTGALMGLSKVILKTMPGIERPAIASFFPTEAGSAALLDLGANVECDADNLCQFAVMGLVFDRVVMNKEAPSVGVLNIGSEAMKGSAVVQDAAQKLGEMTLPGHFHGFVEGDDIPKGKADVVVTDGFTGNVALKTAEGTSRLIGGFMRESFRSSLAAKLGYILARGGLKRLKRRLDPRRYNGAMFLGLNGITVKSHGNSDAVGFANAIEVAVNMASNAIISRIAAELAATGEAAATHSAFGTAEAGE